MSTRYTWTDDSDDVRLSGFLSPEPGEAQPFDSVAITQPAGATTPGLDYSHADLPGASVIIKDDSGFLLERLRAGGANRARLVLDSTTDGGEIILDTAFVYCQPRDDAADGDIYFEVTKKGGTDVITTSAGGGIGFFNATPAAKQTVAGAKLPSDVVLASLLTALVNLGLITDNST